MAGTWQGAGDSGTVQLSTATPPSNQTFSGSFTGTVQNSDVDGSCQVQGGISNGVFSGTWTFVPNDPSSDQSDSGSGTFALDATS
jgi:hypothetical protein